jgi:hypothetical protein
MEPHVFVLAFSVEYYPQHGIYFTLDFGVNVVSKLPIAKPGTSYPNGDIFSDISKVTRLSPL